MTQGISAMGNLAQPVSWPARPATAHSETGGAFTPFLTASTTQTTPASPAATPGGAADTSPPVQPVAGDVQRLLLEMQSLERSGGTSAGADTAASTTTGSSFTAQVVGSDAGYDSSYGYSVTDFPTPFDGPPWFGQRYMSAHESGAVLVSLVVLMLVYDFVTRRTTVGRRIYALGGNAKAARLSGIKTERLAFLTFVNMGALAALAGLVFAARLNTATPKAGLGFELDVIAACFIGGASASGGVGKVLGAVIGAFVMGVMNNGMSILGIGIDYQQVIKGIVLLAAVCVDVYNKNK